MSAVVRGAIGPAAGLSATYSNAHEMDGPIRTDSQPKWTAKMFPVKHLRNNFAVKSLAIITELDTIVSNTLFWLGQAGVLVLVLVAIIVGFGAAQKIAGHLDGNWCLRVRGSGGSIGSEQFIRISASSEIQSLAE